MFTGPQHTLTLRGNLSSPQTMPTEADSWQKLAVPKLQTGGWDNEPHSIATKRGLANSRPSAGNSHSHNALIAKQWSAS